MSFLVTGALGFIGSNFVNYYKTKYPHINIVILDKKDYCSSTLNIIVDAKIVIGDILNKELITYLLYEHKIDTIVHFAAESHVDNSFENSHQFTMTNMVGTHTLLEAARLYHNDLGLLKKFIHTSTDEIYGDITNGERCCENAIINPTNPYACSKAAAELMVKSYYKSFKLPIIITRCNNVYGVNQYPEKIIPKFICQLLDNTPITIHGTGTSKRHFIHVDDVVAAYDCIIEKGTISEIYNIGAYEKNEYTVMAVAKIIMDIMGKGDDVLTYVKDRNINDQRYYTISKKLEELGWLPAKINFINNIEEIIDWYKLNKDRYYFNK